MPTPKGPGAKPPKNEPTSAEILEELASTYPAVRERLERRRLAGDPKALAKVFRENLKRLKGSSRYRDWREAGRYAADLEVWISQVSRELLPISAKAAQDLLRAFIESDSYFFEHADDSHGEIGTAMRMACDAWLQAAALAGDSPGATAGEIKRLYEGDDYGGRESLLRHAHTALPEPELRALVQAFQQSLEALVGRQQPKQNLPYGVFKVSGALGLLSEALRDPEVSVRAVLTYSPQPNALQRAEFARDFLQFGYPEKALNWLEEPWDRSDLDRLRLRAQALLAMGRTDEAAEVRRAVFEDSGSVHDYQQWKALLAPEEQAQAKHVAMQKAIAHEEVIEGALLLMAIDEADAAERLLEAKHGEVDGSFYGRLTDLADELHAQSKVIGSVVCHRALLLGILSRGKATAYSHAARYLKRLRALEKAPYRATTMESHEAFEATLRAAHGRKTAFWTKV